jgi:hypothetical protein
MELASPALRPGLEANFPARRGLRAHLTLLLATVVVSCLVLAQRWGITARL